MKNRVLKVFAVLIAALTITACTSTGELSPDDQAIERGVKAWNNREPHAAAAYWDEIGDSKKAKRYASYITNYEKGAEALDQADATRRSYESKRSLLSTTALDYFCAIGDRNLLLPGDICDRGSDLAADSVSYLLAKGDFAGAKKMHERALSAYGKSSVLTAAGNEVSFVAGVNEKRKSFDDSVSYADTITSLESQVIVYDNLLSEYEKEQAFANSQVSKLGLGNKKGAQNALASLKQGRQNVEVKRQAAIRDRAYDFKNQMGEEFAKSPKGDQKKMKWSELLTFYEGVNKNIEVIFNDLLDFQGKYPEEVGTDIVNDVKDQKRELESKIAQINREIANEKEIASRGNKVMPILIGLFNPDPSSTAESKKSRPAKFSSSNAKKAEYWWGMISIPKGQMNDLVITMKDNRTVRVFNENTKSGKLIEKNNLKDLVNRANKVGNSWPVMNAGKQLKSNKYFFEVQKGKTDSYEGEVVVYSSFVTRMR